ncbi:MAG: hypothetical protein RR614_11025, partial [Eubacterium sp.]
MPTVLFLVLKIKTKYETVKGEKSMIGPSTIDFILSNLGISMWDYLTKHKEQFEAVNTGRVAEGEYIYHGPANDPKACRHCGGKLIGKKMTLKTK